MSQPRGSTDTIFAPATGAGRAAIAVIRISGPGSRHVCQRLTGRSVPPPRRAALRRLVDPGDREQLDQGLVLWFPAPESFTGEDMLELQVHGSRAVLAGLLDALAAMPGLRPAEAGEFSRRAFVNGRIDLTGVEALADLIAAETRAQARQALRQLDGELGRLYDAWRERLLVGLARLEAEIDFAAEEEVPEGLVDDVRQDVVALSAEIAGHLADDRGERLREGLTVAVVGAPNVGKSSLVNRLARRDVAIVTARPGTTRDVLEVHLDLGGYPVTLLDTAGLREAADEIEAEGVRRARQRAASADLKLVLLDATTWPETDAASLALIDDDALIAINKADLVNPPRRPELCGRPALVLSCKTGAGLARLLAVLEEKAGQCLAGAEGPLLTRSRHRAALRDAADALARFAGAPPGTELALLAEDLRLATRALGRITGAVGVEDLLDRIFSEFCIGK